MRNGALGDFVLTLPVFLAFQEYFLNYRLYVIGRTSFCSLLSKSWNVIDNDSRDWSGLYGNGSLPKQTLDLFANTTLALVYSKPYGNLLKNMKNLLAEKALFFDPQPPINFSGHIIDHLLTPLTKTLKIPVYTRTPKISISKPQKCKIDVIAHVGSSSLKKNWALENFIVWAGNLRRRGMTVKLIQGPIEKETGIAATADFPITYPESLEQLTSLLASATLFVGNDSGPGHLAAALGTKTLTLFGPTNPQIWKPYHLRNLIISAQSKSMKDINVESVILATLKQLAD